MKTITKSSKTILVGILAMFMFVVTAFGLAACDNKPENTDGITKYEATFDASITMGNAGPQSFSGVFSDAYVTKEKDDYTLTIIFKAGPLTVMGITGTIFIDDEPENPKSETDGTIGWYKKDGTLVTDGITVTYSSGDNYASTPSKKNVYYVQSVSFKVDELRESYDLTLYFNSNMMGMQFSKDGYPATLNLDLTSGTAVEEITGLGVATKGTAPQPEPEYVEYTLPIVSLTSKAPLPAVKEAFNKAFGEEATLIVYKNGTKKLRIKNEHMIIDLSGSQYDANVTSIQGSTVISSKKEVYSDFSTQEKIEITVPDVFEIDYVDDCNGVLNLIIGVDFMAKMMNNENYSTTVTLTLDISSLNL